MRTEWSDRNKTIQKLLGKEDTYKEGIDLLIEFRRELFEQITQIVNGYPREAFYQMPFAGADGYHSKTLAYSIWHIFRIEDIVEHTLIQGDEQILFSKGYREKIGCDIITTGNELKGEDLAEFSKKLDVDSLYEYAKAVIKKLQIIYRQRISVRHINDEQYCQEKCMNKTCGNNFDQRQNADLEYDLFYKVIIFQQRVCLIIHRL